MKRPEDAIQRAVFQHLRARGVAGLVAIHVGNGGYRRPVEARIMKGLGVTAGVPDVLAWHDSRAYALELKPDGGRLSEAQAEMLARLDAAGVFTAVCHGRIENTRRHKRLGFWKMSGIKGRSGRRPGDTATLWADALRVAVSREDVDGRKKLARLADRCVEAAFGGDMTAMKEIGDRLDGKPRQSMDMTTAARKPIREMTDEEIAARIAELEAERIAELEAQSADASEEDAEAESAPPVTH